MKTDRRVRQPGTLKGWLVWQLRRLSYKWPPRNEALRKARIERGKYTCAKCKKIYGNKDISLDHIEPVIDPKRGWQNFDVYIERLFCSAEGFQVLCHKCHDLKTAKEKQIRKEYKRRTKEAA